VTPDSFIKSLRDSSIEIPTSLCNVLPGERGARSRNRWTAVPPDACTWSNVRTLDEVGRVDPPFVVSQASIFQIKTQKETDDARPAGATDLLSTLGGVSVSPHALSARCHGRTAQVGHLARRPRSQPQIVLRSQQTPNSAQMRCPHRCELEQHSCVLAGHEAFAPASQRTIF
jgi:hypothetical protein